VTHPDDALPDDALPGDPSADGSELDAVDDEGAETVNDTDNTDGLGWVEPTPEQYAERARKANRATRGAMAGVLILEALVVLLIPRAIAFTTGLGATRTTICFVVAGLLVVSGGLLRRPWGIAVGSAMQLVFFLTGIMIVTMFLVGAIFAAIWLRLLMLRHEVIGGPGGVRMLAG
jgi:hypothetical protein